MEGKPQSYYGKASNSAGTFWSRFRRSHRPFGPDQEQNDDKSDAYAGREIPSGSLEAAAPNVVRWLVDNNANDLPRLVLLEFELVPIRKKINLFWVVEVVNLLANPVEIYRNQTNKQPNGPGPAIAGWHQQLEDCDDGKADEKLDDCAP